MVTPYKPLLLKECNTEVDWRRRSHRVGLKVIDTALLTLSCLLQGIGYIALWLKPRLNGCRCLGSSGAMNPCAKPLFIATEIMHLEVERVY